MTAPSPEPLHRTNINLFAADVEQLRKRYGTGWSEQIRNLVRRDCQQYEIYQRKMKEAANG